MLIAAKVTPRILPGVTAIGKVRGLKRICLVTGSITAAVSYSDLSPPFTAGKGKPVAQQFVQIEKV